MHYKAVSRGECEESSVSGLISVEDPARLSIPDPQNAHFREPALRCASFHDCGHFNSRPGMQNAAPKNRVKENDR